MTDLEKIKKDPDHLKNIINQTYELCSTAIGIDGLAFRHIKFGFINFLCFNSEKKITSLEYQKLKLQAVSNNPTVIKFFNPNDRVPILKALSINGNTLSLIEYQYRTKEYCKEALNTTPDAIRWVPEKYQTEEVFLDVISRNPKLFILVKNQTEKLIELAINLDPENYNLVEDKKKKYLLLAIEKNPSYIRFLNDFTGIKVTDLILKKPEIILFVEQNDANVEAAMYKDCMIYKHIRDRDKYLDCFLKNFKRQFGLELVKNEESYFNFLFRKEKTDDDDFDYISVFGDEN